YKILDELGEGGFGVVYLAEQQQPVRRRVALKVIKPGMDSRQVLARFAAEQQTLALMNHPGVAQVYDAGLSDEGRPYFAMELVIGEPIHHYCDRRRLPIDKRVELFIQVCDAVQHAHMKGVIHRDLKPGNILVESTEGGPRVKVIDFGVSKALHAVPGRGDMVTEQGQMLGTPEFMSPEQAGGGTELIDTRSDVYSLGVVLYHILTGALPFETARLRGGGPQNIVRVIREEEPAKPSMTVAHLRTRTREHGRSGGGSKIASSAAAPTPPPERDGTVAWRGPGPDGTPTSPHTPLSEIANKRGTDEPTLRKRLRGDLDWIVMTCLEKDPARRYDSASALGRDLRRYLERLPVSAGPPSAGYQLTKFLRRNKLAVSAAGLVAAALVVGLAGTTFGLVRANEAADLAARRAEDAKAALEFQAEQLGAIDPQSLGASIVSQLESLLAAGVEDAEIREAMLAELPGLNGTDIARR
ncbi:MAG: serine/threonine-protein kinase, partial [Planctomycetota bacterium]